MNKLDRTINYLGLLLALAAISMIFIPPKCGDSSPPPEVDKK